MMNLARRAHARYGGQLAELFSLINAAGYRYSERFHCCAEPDTILAPPTNTDMWGIGWWPNQIVIHCINCGEDHQRSANLQVSDDYGNYLYIDHSFFMKWVENKAKSLKIWDQEDTDQIDVKMQQKLSELKYELDHININGTDFSKNRFMDFEHDLGDLMVKLVEFGTKVEQMGGDPMSMLRQKLLNGVNNVNNG